MHGIKSVVVVLLLVVASAIVGLLWPHPNVVHIGYEPILLSLIRINSFHAGVKAILIRSYAHYCLISFIVLAIIVAVRQRRRKE
jgi:hypothetical protein